MNPTRNESGGGLVLASRKVLAVADSSEMRDWTEQLVARARLCAWASDGGRGYVQYGVSQDGDPGPCPASSPSADPACQWRLVSLLVTDHCL